MKMTADQLRMMHARPPRTSAAHCKTAPAPAQRQRPHCYRSVPEMASEKKTVLLTGATGFVGGQCRKFWGDKYKLILADNRPMSEAKDSSRTEGGGDTSLAAHESFTLLDITVYEDFLAACQGVDTVVHLAATPGAPDDPEGFYGSLLPLNVIGTYNAFAAASAAGCKRIVYASSVNAVLGYVGNNEDGVNPEGGWSSPNDGEYTPGREQYHVDGTAEGSGNRWDAPVWPVNVYGATKCWGEALARTFSTSHGLSCVCVRLGGFPADINGDPSEIPADAFDRVSNAVSYRDAAQVFGKCVDVSDEVPFLIVAALSDHELSAQDIQHTKDSIGCAYTCTLPACLLSGQFLALFLSFSRCLPACVPTYLPACLPVDRYHH